MLKCTTFSCIQRKQTSYILKHLSSRLFPNLWQSPPFQTISAPFLVRLRRLPLWCFFDQAHSSLVIIIGNWINNDHVIIERGRHSPAVSNFKFSVNSSVKSPNWYIYISRPLHQRVGDDLGWLPFYILEYICWLPVSNINTRTKPRE